MPISESFCKFGVLKSSIVMICKKMKYDDYLNNAEKHFMYCKETMSIDWEDRFLQELYLYIKGKSQYYLGKYNVQYIVDKLANPNLNTIDVDKLNVFFQNVVENDKYDTFSLKDINYYESVTNNRVKCESEWVKPLQKRLVEIYNICLSYTNDAEILKKISADLHNTTNDYKKKIEKKFNEQQKKLFYIYLNTFYVSGYIYEGIAMFSILKLLGFKNSDLPSSLKELGNPDYYDEQQLNQYVEDDLQGKFGNLIEKHVFKEYINIIRGNRNLNFEQQNIEFVGKEIKDNTLKTMVGKWSPKIRYEQFDNNHLFRIPNISVNLKKEDIDSLLGLSETILSNVKDKIRI